MPPPSPTSTRAAPPFLRIPEGEPPCATGIPSPGRCRARPLGHASRSRRVAPHFDARPLLRLALPGAKPAFVKAHFVGRDAASKAAETLHGANIARLSEQIATSRRGLDSPTHAAFLLSTAAEPRPRAAERCLQNWGSRHLQRPEQASMRGTQVSRPESSDQSPRQQPSSRKEAAISSAG